MPFSSGQLEFQGAICKALGLDPRYVYEIALMVTSDSPPSITAKMWPDVEQLRAITQKIGNASWQRATAVEMTQGFELASASHD